MNDFVYLLTHELVPLLMESGGGDDYLLDAYGFGSAMFVA